MPVTHVVLIFLVASIKIKEIGEVNFNNVLY